ncbi:MAG: hypothetical protein H8E14_09655 [Candidatus Marinimicrobia bacterium]|nr:hypothetical protein [Candidatus Neomarinimicrobiota bacterium]
MKLNKIQKYDLKIDKDFSYTLSQNGKRCTFTNPLTVSGVAKLYTVAQDKILFYVGIAKQSMASRINGGLKAEGKNGYYGYKWKGIRSNLHLNVWTAEIDGKYISLNELEIIEAEVAYLCRQLSDNWPKHQHEIHFHQSNSNHRELAKIIYDAATKYND